MMSREREGECGVGKREEEEGEKLFVKTRGIS